MFAISLSTRAGYCTEIVLLRIIYDRLSALGENKMFVLLLLDLSAAFDTSDHNICLSRLLAFSSTTGCGFRPLLSERKQFVMVQDHKSPTVPPAFGVPQGSVHGHVFFVLYITPP